VPKNGCRGLPSGRQLLGKSSGRICRAGQSAVCPSHRIGFHRIDLVAFQTPEFGSACPVGHCHPEFFALRASVFIHGVLPRFGRNLIKKTEREVASFIKKVRTLACRVMDTGTYLKSGHWNSEVSSRETSPPMPAASSAAGFFRDRVAFC
jgi:hypothetical protein